MFTVQVKRIYDPPEKKDGLRILVDRLWPRALKKEHAHADIWLKTIAPSPLLRQWFHHDPEKWTIFKKTYTIELKQSPAVAEIMAYGKKNKVITLLYAARDEQHNHAIVLQEYLTDWLK